MKERIGEDKGAVLHEHDPLTEMEPRRCQILTNNTINWIMAVDGGDGVPVDTEEQAVLVWREAVVVEARIECARLPDRVGRWLIDSDGLRQSGVGQMVVTITRNYHEAV
jgi:hypothetical protein